MKLPKIIIVCGMCTIFTCTLFSQKFDWVTRSTVVDTVKIVYQAIQTDGSLKTEIGWVTDYWAKIEKGMHFAPTSTLVDSTFRYSGYWNSQWVEISEYHLFHFKRFDWKP